MEDKLKEKSEYLNVLVEDALRSQSIHDFKRVFIYATFNFHSNIEEISTAKDILSKLISTHPMKTIPLIEFAHFSRISRQMA